MKRFFAMLLCLALVVSLLPARIVFAAEEVAQEETAQTDAEILKQRRDTVYNTMMSMANVLWRATEDFTYYFASSKVTIVKGRLYRGMPYTHARGSLESFLELTGAPNEKGERDMIGLTPEMLDGSSAHARFGNDCSGAASVAYGSVSATTKNVGSSTLTIKNGFLPVGPYKPDPETNSNDDAVVAENGLQVMFESYALAQYADLVACSGHTMMTQAVNVVRNEDGTINGDESTMTVVHQNPDPIRNNRYFTSGPYSEANYGEKVYRTFLIDDVWTFQELYNSGYMPYTCIELIDPSPIEELKVTDTETEHNFHNIMTGTIKANRLIDCVTMTISDEEGNVVQHGRARCYRSSPKGTNYNMEYDLSQLQVESPMKMTGSLNVNLLGIGNYHCQLDVRLMTGQTVEKVRDFDFTVTEEDLCEGWVDNSNLEFTEVDGKKMAVCPVCGGDPVEWKALTKISSNKNLNPGHYYLNKDLNNSARYALANGSKACVHLNGHNITSSSWAFWLSNSKTLFNLMGNGTVMGSYSSEDDNYGATIHLGAATAKMALYGGTYGHTLTSAKPTITLEASQPNLKIYGGATICRMDDAQGANIEIRSGTVELRGGRILDGTNNSGYGGNVRVVSSATFTGYPSTFTMYSGIIAGGRAKHAGNVYVYRASGHGSKDRTFTMEGGLLYYGLAGYAAGSAGYGGNIYATSGAVVNLNGGTVSYGKSYKGGGNLYVTDNAQVTVGNVMEQGNGDYGSDGASGSNIYLYASSTASPLLTVTGTVRDPLTAANYGGNIYCNNSNIVVDGGTVSGGIATSRGGNIYMTNTAASLTVKNNGKIIGGSAPQGGNVGTNISTAVINVESGEISGGIASSYGPDIRLHNVSATVNITGGKVGDIYGEAGKFNLGGNGSIDNLDLPKGTLKIDNNWIGTADVNWGDENVTDGVLTKASCGSTTDGTFTAGGSYTGTLIYDGEARAFGKDGIIRLGTAVINDQGKRWYPTVTEAVESAAENETVKLFTDAALTLNKDTFMDINGNQVTVTGEGKLYGIDSSNDDYEGNGTATVTGAVAKDVTDPATGNRYIALTDENGSATFHRLDMRPTTVALRPGEAGIYYKAQFDCDTVLAQEVHQYGVIVSLDNMPGVDFRTELWDINRYTVVQDPFVPGVEATSGSVFGILKDRNNATINDRNGQMKIYANAYLQLKDGTLLVADQTVGDKWDAPGFEGTAFSLRDVLQTIDDQWSDYEEHQDQVLEFYKTWADKGLGNWQFENIR